MALYKIQTFEDIIAAVREEVQGSTTQTNFTNWIKRDINLVYQEVASEKNWNWLEGTATVQLPAYISSGTVSVTQGSADITFSSAPAASQTGKYFAVDGFNEIYTIESHTAGATTAKIGELFAGSTSATATYKLWTDRIPLPTDCRETAEVWHDHHSVSVEPFGKQDFRKVVVANPRAEGKPRAYYTGDFVDPSQTSTITSLPATLTRASAGVVKTLVFASALPTSLVTEVSDGKPVRLRISGGSQPSYNGDVLVSSVTTTTATNDTITYTGKAEYTESATSDTSFSVRRIDQTVDFDRYRELYLYPCLNTSRVTLHVDYIKDVFPLENDDDEPLIPIQYRSVLVYGALHRVWARLSKEADAARNFQLYQAKLAKMAGKLQDTFDTPRLQPSKTYLNQKRASSRRTNFGNDSSLGSSGSSGSGSVATGTASRAAQFGSDGVLVASSTVSTTELGYLDGVTSAIQTQIDTKAPTASPTFTGTITTPLTASRAVATGASSQLVASATTATELGYVSGVTSAIQTQLNAITALALPTALTTVALNDNQSSAANVVTYTAATYDNIHIIYSIKRGSAIIESGSIDLATDGTNASITVYGTSVGSSGVTFSADVSGGSLRLRYVSTNTGTAPSFKYTEQKWLA